MKNSTIKSIILIAIIVHSFMVSAQRELPDPYANDVTLPPQMQANDLMLTAFVSYPNWEAYLLDLIFDSFASVDADLANTNGVAPIGIRIENNFTPTLSITLDAFFNSVKSRFEENGFPTLVSSARTRILVGFNYHIPDINVEKLDLYGGLALGASTRSINAESDNPNFNQNDYLLNSSPISGRFRVGGRYFFNENFGVNVELGIGGPLMSFGLTYRRRD